MESFRAEVMLALMALAFRALPAVARPLYAGWMATRREERPQPTIGPP
jgi:hypothetical protein